MSAELLLKGLSLPRADLLFNPHAILNHSSPQQMMKSSSEKKDFAPLALAWKTVFVVVALATASCLAQTFEIGGQSQPTQQSAPTPKKGKSRSAAAAGNNAFQNQSAE
ncbi:MAG TPA: hypothetical protein VJT08_19955, partial [Terriglobales bacterium]|nr:hypothetical protein [Terriglobales bacterium]